MREKKTKRCVICKKELLENSFYPFCSERCQMIDLGAWLDEKYVVPDAESKSPEEGDDISQVAEKLILWRIWVFFLCLARF